MKTVTPILRIFDEAKAREFYQGFLGFEEVFQHRFSDDAPIYIGIKRGTCELHLSEHHGDGSPGMGLRIEVDDVVALVSEMQAANYKFARPGGAELKPWGLWEISVTDPFHNRLVFWQADKKPD